MLKFRDLNHIRSTPKSYTLVKPGSSLRIVWQPTFHFHQFYNLVKDSAIANDYDVPSPEVVENDVCSRSGSECTSNETARRPATLPPRKGCKSCGRR
jgi:hypothetical protein